jgi:ribose 5-phosphate isomerase B
MSDVHWVDLGPESDGRVDYPDYADQVALKIAEGAGQGVLICGSGQGMAMRANRYTKVRAALVWNDETVRLARGHNDANILCLGARLIDLDTAKRLVRLFLETPFEGGRHADRVEKLSRKP